MRYIPLSFLVLTLFFLLGNTTYAAPTFFGGTISENTVWTASSSPYILTGKVTIAADATLTLEKGAVIKLSENGIEVNGALYVNGTEAEPVYITSRKDDTVGGDSNNDGGNSTPSAGNWQGIQFNASTTGIFDHAVIRYAGYQRTNSVPAIATIYNRGGEITVRDSELSYSTSCGIGQVSGTVEMQTSKMHHMVCGVGLVGGSFMMHNTTIEDADIGMFSNGAEHVELIDNTFVNNDVTADFDLQNLNFTHTGNTASGGEYNGFLIRGTVDQAMNLTPDSMPYIITSVGGSGGAGGVGYFRDHNLTISSAGSLTFESGTIVKFHDSAALLVHGTLTTNGSASEPVYFTSIADDSVGGDTNGDGGVTAPARGDWLHIKFDLGSEGNLDGTVVRYGGHRYTGGARGHSLSNILNNGGIVTFTNSEVSHALQYGIKQDSGSTTISQSNIHDNGEYGVVNGTQLPLDARNNYWGDPSGPYHETLNPSGLGDRVYSNVLFEPWKGVYCIENCYSNVLFLPGIKGSRLYKKGLLGTEDRIWEPLGNQDVWEMEMTNAGESVNQVYTKDIVNEAYGVLNIYKDFDQFMTNLIDENVIRDWTAFAYDWRYDVETIAENGTQYENDIHDAVDEIERLAQSSLSGKVTIIGHSNGGLLAKAIMRRLEQEGKEGMVDRIVFLASPQLGTPLSIGSILHGYGESQVGDLLIDDAVARAVISNMPGGYGLLPSQEYFNKGPGLKVLFDTSDSTSAFRNVYGNAINNEAELIEFMSGFGDGRAEATTVEEAARANRSMLENASTLHSSVLDNWVAPDGVEVIEVVGVGLDTISGFQYTEFSERICSEPDIFGQQTCENQKFYKPVPLISQYGDQVVMGHSAEGYAGEKVTYYLDLLDIINTRREEKAIHGDITETPSVQMLVRNILEEKSDEIQFVSNTTTVFDRNRVILGGHSPISIKATDKNGAEVGISYENEVTPVIVEDVPGSRYFELAGGKYLVLPTDSDYEIEITGTGEGGLVFTVDLLEGETQTSLHKISVATITASTSINFTYQGESFSNLFVDIDGDGEIDQEITPEGDIINSEVSYDDLLQAINELSLKKVYKNPLLTLVALAKELGNKASENQSFRRFEFLILSKLEDALKLYVKLKLLPSQEIVNTIQIIQKLKN